MLEKFEREKEKLLKAYDKLSASGLVQERSKIEEWKRKLEEEEFIVSFCGQIKAGKSTLLNALIFRKPVLPFSVNPHTAKLTIIKYGETPSFTATFYSREEWDELIKELKKQKDENGVSYYERLKGEVNKRIANLGIYPEAVLDRKEEGLDLERLNDFVGTDGKYTPFVKEVCIYYPNPVLKRLTIVDTPGTNDPNPFRSRETLKWIKNSNAVVYVVYAGQAFNETDVQFIDNYLITVPSNLMVFAVNKVDTLSSLSDLKDWIEKEVKKDGRLKRRKIMADPNSVAFVSALGGLIGRMLEDCEKKGIEPEDCIPEELMEHAENLYSKGFTEEEKHGLRSLEKVIEEKLIETKGLNVLCSHKRRVEGIIEESIRKLKIEIGGEEEKLRLLELDVSELNRELEKVKRDKKDLLNFENDVDREMEELGNKIRKEFVGKFFEDKLQQHKREFERRLELEKFKSIDYDAIPMEAFYLLRDRIEALLGIKESAEYMELAFERIEPMLRRFYAKVLEQDFVPPDMKRIFPVNTVVISVMEILRSEIKENLREVYMQMEKFKEKYTRFFGFLPFVDKGNRSKLLASIKLVSQDVFDSITNEVSRRVKDAVSKELRDIFSSLIRDIEQRISEKERTLNKLKNDLEKKELNREKVRRKIGALKEKLGKMEEIKKTLLSEIQVWGC